MIEDRLLLWKFRHGSKDSFRCIYDKYADDLLTLAGNLLGRRAVAEDVVQDVFTRFVQGVEDFRLRGSLKGYLATCVANRSRDYLRKRKRQQTVAVNDARQVQSNTDGPVQLVINSEQMRLLGKAMENLPYEQREVVVLHLHGDLKFRAIAKLQDVSVKTAYSRYRYGLDKLRSILNGEVIK